MVFEDSSSWPPSTSALLLCNSSARRLNSPRSDSSCGSTPSAAAATGSTTELDDGCRGAAPAREGRPSGGRDGFDFAVLGCSLPLLLLPLLLLLLLLLLPLLLLLVQCVALLLHHRHLLLVEVRFVDVVLVLVVAGGRWLLGVLIVRGAVATRLNRGFHVIPSFLLVLRFSHSLLIVVLLMILDDAFSKVARGSVDASLQVIEVRQVHGVLALLGAREFQRAANRENGLVGAPLTAERQAKLVANLPSSDDDDDDDDDESWLFENGLLLEDDEGGGVGEDFEADAEA